jgi:hypothetical protein
MSFNLIFKICHDQMIDNIRYIPLHIFKLNDATITHTNLTLKTINNRNYNDNII